MTQAPTPGPLTADDVKLLVKLLDTLKPFAEVAEKLKHCHVVEICEPTPDNPSRNIIPMPREWFERAGDDLEYIAIQLHASGVLSEGQASKITGLDRVSVRREVDRLAPTAPVEASGSEREGIIAVIDRNKCEPWTVDRAGQMADEILNLRPQPSGFLATLTDEQREEALAYTGDDTHPQPSGETRVGYDRSDVRYGLQLIADEECDEVAASYYAKKAIALLSARPLALGGQQGEACRGCGHVGPVPKDRIACCPDGKRYDTTPVRAEAPSDDLRTACQAVLDDYQTSDAHHPDHVLIRRTDFERIKALVEAPVIARAEAPSEDDARRRLIQRIEQWDGEMEYDAEDIAALADDILHEFNGAPVVARAEAQDEGAAGDLRAILRNVVAHATGGSVLNGDELGLNDICCRITQMRNKVFLDGRESAHPSPTPAADADRVRIAVEALELAGIRFDEIHEAAEVDDVAYRNEATIHGINANADVARSEVRQALAALKSEGE